MIAYLRRMADCRFFWQSLVLHDIRRRYRSSLIGMAWAIMQPALLALVICFVFTHAFQAGSADYFLHILSGLCLWGFLTHVISAGCQSIRSAESYILQHRLPMAAYPLRYALVGKFHLLMALLPVVAVSLTTGAVDLRTACLFPFVLLLLIIFGWSAATIFGIAHVYFPDTQHLCQIAMTVLFYCTPIVWRPEMIRARHYGWIIDCNPFAAFAALLRRPFLGSSGSTVHAILLAVGTTGVTFLLAILLLRKHERKIVFYL